MALCSYTLPFYRHIVITVIILWHLQQVNSAYEEDDDHHEGYVPMLHGEIDEMCEEPPPPMNGEINCGQNKKRKNKYVCRAECEPGFEFPNGKSKKRHICDMETGKWSPKFIFPDCRPICNPPCENGGECSDANHCICTAQYRGDRCQYAISLCQPNEGLHASADWSCNHTMAETLCVFNCPQNTRYESQPADVYHCSLDGTWMPSFAPKCIPINIIEPPASPALYTSPTGQIINSKLPKSAVCATWSASHYRTFDGGIYSFQGRCSYLFAKDCEQNTFAIHIQNGEVCDAVSSCPTTVAIYIGAEQYLLSNGDEGPVVVSAGETHIVPTAVNGLLFEMISDYVTLISPLGFNLKWNRKNTILLKVNSQLRNRTCGLCGKFDGSTMNDFETSDGSNTDSVEGFANSWIMDELGEKCQYKGVVKDPCSDNKDKVTEAEKLCQAIFEKKFEVCHQLVDPKIYYEACKMDHCGCQSPGTSCYCGSLAEYFRECIRVGGKIDGGWRSEDVCPLACPDGMIYQDCGTSCPKTCKGTVYDCEGNHCVDGCHCPDGTYLHNGRCLERQSCPCLHGGKEYQPGERMLQDCNACECNAGDWQCTDEKCEARCSSTGDPHYTTFDGLSYEFLGSCPYYLVYHTDFTIVQESGPCPASASSEPATESMFCTLAIKIAYLGDSLILQPGIKMSFNEKEVSLPFSAIGFNAAMVSDIFLRVILQNGVSVLWDGENRIYVDAPPTLFGQTMGLCGTFNHNQNDDFQTPEKDVEADVATFASRWQASDTCHKRTRRSMRSPCETQPQKLSDAKMLCSAIIGEVFQACHGELEPDVYYKSCISDLCLCGENLQDCVCPILADYSLSCAKRGIILNWVDDIPPCKPDCTGGQVYKECGNPCTSSCMAIASSENCKSQCVQGCICPDGMTMSSEGFCIAIDQCPCVFDNKEYSPASVTVQGSSICTCQSAKWECRPGTLEELVYMNPDLMVQDQPTGAKTCLAENNEEFTQCVETCPKTCQNAHLPPRCKTEECKPGCRCKEGFILDADLKACVKETQCGCLHSGRRYKEGETIKQHCNLCFCSEGSWQCTEKVCPGVCSSWGESHFKTYDGKIFDFQGECEYILSKGKMKGASFTLSVQNVPCGTNGITCSKSFTLDLGPTTSEYSTSEYEKLTLSRDDPLPKVSYNSRFVVMDAGLFVLVFSDVGISLQWDRGTRLYINADPKWRNRVKGVCGNFNDDQTDDFLTPSGGIPEARASIFADSWKIHEFCPLPQTVEDMCSVHPQRQGWAQQKCGILKSDVFAPCHSAVKLDPYYERCVFDSCACDMGGDCDCLCTAIAAYAHECSAEGVPIKWRSQELCPIQCEECATYESCIPSCPKMTCENELIYGKIKEACTFDFCVEGCNPKPCPEGQIYNNGREYKCVPQVDCVAPCMEINGVLYNEGDRITDPKVTDSCQSCHCRRGSIHCVGEPCVKEQPQACLQGGWTPWMNTPSFIGGDREDLKHPLLRTTYDRFCGIANMTNIECRVSESKTPYKETGQNVDCSLPTGLTCRDDEQNNEICKDYEIRVFCDCGAELLKITLPPTTPHPPLPPICEETGWTAWMNAHLPGEEGESETLENLRINHQFCVDEEIENIECRTTLGWKEAPAGDSAICNKKLGLVCSGSDCNDYEVRVFCNCGKEIPTTPSCVSGWTEYFNTDNPDVSDIGDDESLERIRELYTVCIGGTVEDIECKTKINGETVDYSTLDTFGLKCSKNVGFVCNKYVRTDKCPDFFVRFYCACEPVVPTTPVKTRLLPTTPTPVPVTPVPVECGWTPWLNLDTPESSENDDGDIEDLSQIQMLYKTCGGKDLVDIECRISRTHHSYLKSQQKNLVCDVHKGFRCFNDEQIGNCYDYEIRVLCMYDWCYPPTTTPVQTTPLPTTTQNPCPDGQVFDECAYRCDRLCSSFAYELSGQCAQGDCIASCRPVEDCEPPNMWRDYYSCVPKDECPCVLIEGDTVTSVAPNDVLIKDCEKCQCVYNDLTCFDIPE
ncbi:SCO-spondin-like, partial [Stegodyphus dumicola]|uniref:SCO-spondin-like n=1 Tax=Stegodyphus dumicola TaxID=202533 RepID=UPI0015AEC2B2